MSEERRALIHDVAGQLVTEQFQDLDVEAVPSRVVQRSIESVVEPVELRVRPSGSVTPRPAVARRADLRRRPPDVLARVRGLSLHIRPGVTLFAREDRKSTRLNSSH